MVEARFFIDSPAKIDCLELASVAVAQFGESREYAFLQRISDVDEIAKCGADEQPENARISDHAQDSFAHARTDDMRQPKNDAFCGSRLDRDVNVREVAPRFQVLHWTLARSGVWPPLELWFQRTWPIEPREAAAYREGSRGATLEGA